MNKTTLYNLEVEREIIEANLRWYNEVPNSDYVYLECYDTQDRMHRMWEPYKTYTELGYMDKLNKVFPYLTDKQQNIIILLLEGNNQDEMAVKLGVTQGTISLSLNGVKGYGYNKKYGGLYKAIKEKLSLIEKWEALNLTPPIGLRKTSELLVCPKCNKIRPYSGKQQRCIGCTAPKTIECIKNNKTTAGNISKETIRKAKLYIEMEERNGKK